jgi:hypothetical protein
MAPDGSARSFTSGVHGTIVSAISVRLHCTFVRGSPAADSLAWRNARHSVRVYWLASCTRSWQTHHDAAQVKAATDLEPGSRFALASVRVAGGALNRGPVSVSAGGGLRAHNGSAISRNAEEAGRRVRRGIAGLQSCGSCP